MCSVITADDKEKFHVSNKENVYGTFVFVRWGNSLSRRSCSGFRTSGGFVATLTQGKERSGSRPEPRATVPIVSQDQNSMCCTCFTCQDFCLSTFCLSGSSHSASFPPTPTPVPTPPPNSGASTTKFWCVCVMDSDTVFPSTVDKIYIVLSCYFMEVDAEVSR